MLDSSLNDEVAGGDEQALGEKLPDSFEVKSPQGFTYTCDGAIELYRLVLEDPDQLRRRAEEITVDIINATCSITRECECECVFKEVRQAPLQNCSSGDTTVPRLLLQSLGLSDSAAEQGRRSKQGDKREQWTFDHAPMACSFKWGLR